MTGWRGIEGVNGSSSSGGMDGRVVMRGRMKLDLEQLHKLGHALCFALAVSHLPESVGSLLVAFCLCPLARSLLLLLLVMSVASPPSSSTTSPPSASASGIEWPLLLRWGLEGQTVDALQLDAQVRVTGH